mmetsp:Transcript_16972/g.25090  ORF Transcript_16972/g.25090 Transcript_16972/m.25090 type:complete len:271 (-) Transcript_16972:34-846(-)
MITSCLSRYSSSLDTFTASYDSYRDKIQNFMLKFTPVQHIILGAVLSITTGILETLFSLKAGRGEGSDGIYSITILGIAEVLGGLLVIYRWAMISQSVTHLDMKKRESVASAMIATLLVLLGTTLFQTALFDLIRRESPNKLWAGIGVSIFGIVTGYALYKYKFYYGTQLQSMVALTDAKCNKFSYFVSISVVLVLIVQKLVWWADGVIGLILSSYIIWDGYKNLQEAYQQYKDAQSSNGLEEYGENIETEKQRNNDPLIRSRIEESVIF